MLLTSEKGGSVMRKFEEKTLQTEEVFNGRIISLQVDQVELPNGKTSTREIVNHPGAVAILPITRDRKIILVKQYRKALERTLIEIPAGLIEKGEAPERTAVRELEEETGYTTNEIHYMASFYTAPGFCNEMIHLYWTNALEQLKEPVQGDEDEFIEQISLTLEEAKEYIRAKKIYDAKTIYALLYYETLGLL